MEKRWVMNPNKDLNDYEKYITREEKRWTKEKNLLGREKTIEDERKFFCNNKKAKKSTSKLLITFLFGNCIIIELFTCWVMVRMLSIVEITGGMMDFSPLNALIGAIIGQVIGYAIYAVKSTKENTSGGIVFERAMQQTPDIVVDNELSPPDENLNGVG